MDESFEAFLSQVVVLDTGGPVVYIGTLVAVNASGFVLESADVHDERSGHATNETYLNETRLQGVSVNRRRVMVMRAAVTSVSRLSDVTSD